MEFLGFSRSMKTLALLLSCLALLVPGPHGARAGETLSLVTGEDYPPFVDAREPGGGFAVMLVQQVMQRMDVTETIETAPWRRGYEETLRGRFDATFPYVRTPDREREFLYSEPLIRVRQAVFMAADRRFAYRGPADLNGRRVCMPLGYAPAAALQPMIDNNEVERVTAASAAACPGLLAAGRADLFIQDLRIGSALIAKAGLADRIVAVSEPPFGITEIHLIVPRSRPGAADLIARFNAALAKTRSSGDYERLLMQ
jgi:polar amino acid transport system substrate-binding protein